MSVRSQQQATALCLDLVESLHLEPHVFATTNFIASSGKETGDFRSTQKYQNQRRFYLVIVPFGGDFWCWMIFETQKISEILSANVRGSTVRIACGSDRLHISTFGPCKLKGRHATTFRGLLSQRTTRARVRHQIFSHQGKKSKHQRHHVCKKRIYRENWVAMKKVGRLAAVSSNFTPKLQPTGTGNLLQFFSHQPGGKFSLPKFVCLFCWLSAPRVFLQNVTALFQLMAG